jgi:hypothetical protein
MVIHGCETCYGTATSELHMQMWCNYVRLRITPGSSQDVVNQERVPFPITHTTLMSDQPHNQTCQALHMHAFLRAIEGDTRGGIFPHSALNTILLYKLLTSTVPTHHLHLQVHLKASIPHLLATNRRPLSHHPIHLLQSQHLDHAR